MNIKLLRPADFNKKLREHGVDKRTTVQRHVELAETKEMSESSWIEYGKSRVMPKSVYLKHLTGMKVKCCLRRF